MIYLKETINQYIDSAKDEFIKTYTNELDGNILKMITHFGYEGEDLNGLSEWLTNENYELLMDNEEKNGNSYKSIYLLNKTMDRIMALFMVEIFVNEDDAGYRFTDIFIRGDVD